MRKLEIEEASAVCRTLNHAWDEWAPIASRLEGRGWHFTLRCVRCHTERHDLINAQTGELDRRKYVYPKNYKYKGANILEARLDTRKVLKSYGSEKAMLRRAG